jgi:integrase
MPRRRKPFWNENTQQWEAWVYDAAGKRSRQPLGVRDKDDETTAWIAFGRVTGAKLARGGPAMPIREVFALFRAHLEATTRPKNVEWSHRYLKSFSSHVGGATPVADLIPLHLTQWADKHWPAPKSQHHPKRAVKAAFHWATEQKLIDENPFASVRVGKAGRLREVLSTAQRQLLQDQATDEAERMLLTVLEATACRVNELRTVEARHVWRNDAGEPIAWIFPANEHKTGRKRQLPRVVILPESAATITAKLCAANPEGPIFRNSKGAPWTANAIRCRFRRRRLRKDNAGKFPARLRGTHYRHTTATELSAAGVNLDAIRQITGHADLTMLDETYLHEHGVAELIEHLKKIGR